MVVFKELIFVQFLLLECVVMLKELILTVSTLGDVVVLKELIFNSFYVGRVCQSGKELIINSFYCEKV